MNFAIPQAATAAVNLGRAAIGAAGQQTQRAVAAAREFESIFLAQVLNSMTSGLGENTGFDGGHAETQWRGLMNEHLAKNIAAGGGVGIAQSVTRELIRAQEARR